MHQITVPNELVDHYKKMSRLLSSNKVDIIDIQMRAGEIIPMHNAREDAVVVVRKGEVFFNVDGMYHRMKDSDIVVLEPLENHSLEAITDVELIVLKIQ